MWGHVKQWKVEPHIHLLAIYLLKKNYNLIFNIVTFFCVLKIFFFFFWIFHTYILMDLVKASQGHTLNLSKYRFSQYPRHQFLWIFFYKRISLNFCILSYSVHLVLFYLLFSNSVHLGLLRSTLVLFRPILIPSFLFTLVLFGPFVSYWIYSVQFGPIQSILSTLFLFGPFGPIIEH